MSIQLPVLLNDGSTLLIDSDFEHRLHHGDATVGWIGDERMGLYAADGRIELRRLCEDGELRVICRSKPGVRFVGTELLRALAEHDSRSRRKYDAHEDIVAHNTAILKGREEARQAAVEQAADKLHFALKKDIGAHVGGNRHRQMALPEAPWLKKDDAK